jgi:hypothetical protein
MPEDKPIRYLFCLINLSVPKTRIDLAEDLIDTLSRHILRKNSAHTTGLADF